MEPKSTADIAANATVSRAPMTDDTKNDTTLQIRSLRFKKS
jgi:hypothetical protein